MHRMLRKAAVAAVVFAVLATAAAAAAATPETTNLVGRLHVNAQVLRDGTMRVTYQLETTSGTKRLRIPVPPTVTPKQRRAIRKTLNANANAYVQAAVHRRDDDTYAVFSITPLQTPPIPQDLPPLTPNPKRIAFVIVHWAGVGMNGVLDANAVRSWALTSPTSLAAYYRAATNNVVQISGDVLSVTLPGGSDAATSCVPLSTAIQGAEATIGSQLAPYTNVMFLTQFTGAGPCGIIGLGQAPGRYTAVSGDWTKDETHFVHVAAHEFGHNLGLLHAGSVGCPGVVPTDTCLSDDTIPYGDPFDAMGNAYPPAQFSGTHKAKLAALSPFAVQTAAAGTHDYWIYASDAPGLGGARLLRVPRGATGQTYTLEIRAPVAPWAPWQPSAFVANGVSIRLVNTDGSAITDNGDDSILIDTSPQSSPQFDAPLPMGGTYSDPANGVNINVLFAGSAWAHVSVTRP